MDEGDGGENIDKSRFRCVCSGDDVMTEENSCGQYGEVNER